MTYKSTYAILVLSEIPEIIMEDRSEIPSAPAGSILDRVLSSQHAAAIEGFVPTESFASLMKQLSDKEADVIRRRFGLSGDHEETLEEIGRVYKVTRERIRQIENSVVTKIRASKTYRDLIGPIERLLIGILTTHGGIMEEQSFFQETLSTAGNGAAEQRALTFILQELLPERIERRPADAEFRTAWKLTIQSLDLVRQAVSEIVTIVDKHGSPMLQNDLFESFRSTPFFQEHQTWFTDEVLLSYVTLSTKIGKNPFGEYGLTSWGTIAPKRMNDKIYLVLKKHGKPLHFTEIAKRINDAGFDRRQAYPPTVHNELILNDQYVLVGRGIYALKEWGFKPGVVADVLADILRKHAQPMSRDELVQAVLAQRMVKRNTVLLALTNKHRFTRHDDGSYSLAVPA